MPKGVYQRPCRPPTDGKFDAERLRSLLDYDPETGKFTWRVRTSNRVDVGRGAGCREARDGYIYIRLDDTLYKAHRLAWLYVHGEWPIGALDHINGIPGDNRIVNLRAASPSQNSCNQRRQSNNSSGFKGVSWYKRDGKWKAHITYRGKGFHLGYFDTAEEAYAAYCAKAKELHGEFARLA